MSPNVMIADFLGVGMAQVSVILLVDPAHFALSFTYMAGACQSTMQRSLRWVA